jgi:hypothetical protein
MTKPTTVVSFSNSLDIDGNPIWNNISSYVLTVEINRGKSNDLDAYSTGTATITLNNRSRAFEPNYVASPYYGLIEPNGQIKVVSGAYTEFVGIIDNWSFGYAEKGINATAQISATDNLAVLAKNTLSNTTFSAQLSGSRVRSILYGSDVYYTDPSCIDTGTRTITSDTVSEGSGALDYLQKLGTNDGALFFARRDGILAYQDSTWVSGSGLPTFRYNLACNSNFNIAPAGFWTGGTRYNSWAYQGTFSYGNSASYFLDYSETSAGKYLVNTPYNVSFYLRSSVSQSMTVYGYMTNAGVPNTDTSVSQTFTMAANEVRRVNLGVVKSALTTDGITFGVTLDSRTPASGTIFMDCALVEQGVTLETYFDGASTTSAPSGQTYTFSFQGTANNSTSVWQTVVDTNVDFSAVYSVTDANYSGIRFNDVSMSYASEKLFNKINVNGSSLSSVASDSSSQSKYGLKEYAITDAILNTQTDNDSLAQYLLSQFHLPDFRAEAVSFNLHNLNSTDQNVILSLDLLSQINLKFIPGNTGAALSGNYQVIGINQTISPEEHMVELRVTSLDKYGFVLDHPVLGILDTNRLV